MPGYKCESDNKLLLQVILKCFLHFSHEYQIFQKILKLEYNFPEGFHNNAKDLVENLLVSIM